MALESTSDLKSRSAYFHRHDRRHWSTITTISRKPRRNNGRGRYNKIESLLLRFWVQFSICRSACFRAKYRWPISPSWDFQGVLFRDFIRGNLFCYEPSKYLLTFESLLLTYVVLFTSLAQYFHQRCRYSTNFIPHWYSPGKMVAKEDF